MEEEKYLMLLEVIHFQFKLWVTTLVKKDYQ